ncbi:hypothetical protein LTR47_006824 [Exophiala xenobiotica]|nr:hypothetical protein LTR72_001151 [Exophiala xenobiotica]KAK5231984.1 hypothetical protein LTR47_006824 [Exophiala xenobiotica]KAK5250692.1 hypothetical protein LTS06_004576 [Exophiala xenobiotica]KAK5260824.1 hypothetical protein LTR40_003416 [Exophiala xenobiotica]KAK5353256.1 hypothetical protein LTR61_003214 [Exophiala xenobiotica]
MSTANTLSTIAKKPVDRSRFVSSKPPTSRTDRDSMAQPASTSQTVGDDDKTPTAFTNLPCEIHLKLSKYLDYDDLCNLGATCRTLRDRMTHETTGRLKKELSQAWNDIGGVFKNEYHFIKKPRLPQHDVVKQQVYGYALVRGYSKIIAKWLVNPSTYHFPCTKCKRTCSMQLFDCTTLVPSFLHNFPDRPYRPQSHHEFYEALICGDCLVTKHRGLYYFLGTGDHRSRIINCDECHMIKVSADDMTLKLMMSCFCEECFRKLNNDWFQYKAFVQDTLEKMKQHEDNPAGHIQWKALPQCPLSAEKVQALTSRLYKFVLWPGQESADTDLPQAESKKLGQESRQEEAPSATSRNEATTPFQLCLGFILTCVLIWDAYKVLAWIIRLMASWVPALGGW